MNNEERIKDTISQINHCLDDHDEELFNTDYDIRAWLHTLAWQLVNATREDES